MLTFLRNVLLLVIIAFPDPDPQKGYKEFYAISEASERFVGVVRRGDGADRRPRVTVFEVMEDGERLRALHSVTLLNPVSPGSAELSSDGRFLITMDDFAYEGDGPHALVIYDLVRREHSAHAADQFLPKNFNKHVPTLPGFRWRSWDGAFNASSTKYYPTIPEVAAREKYPNVVIDLPTRIPTIEKSDKNPADLAPLKKVKFKGAMYTARNTWKASQAIIELKDQAMPRFLNRSWPSERPSQTFEYDSSSGEFLRVSKEKGAGR
jgi:hypothetical protein